MASGSLEIVLFCYCALFRPYDLDILLAWHHACMLSCSHARGVIMLLHFPAPTALCPACSQSPPATYVQRDAPSLSRFPLLDSSGFEIRAPAEAKRSFFENKGFPDLVIMKWQGIDAIRPNATRRFIQEGSQGFRLRETEDIVTGTENFFKQPTTRLGRGKSRSGGQSNIGSDKGQIRSGNQTPISKGFRRNIQSLTGASPEQLRAYGLLT